MNARQTERWTTVLVLLYIALAVNLQAKTLYVGTDKEFQTIQSAIDAASNGDEIIVDIGVYTEEIDLASKAITISVKCGAAIIDGGTSNNFGVIISGDNARISHFVIRNCQIGILCGSGSPTIDQCDIINNPVGIKVIDGGTPLIRNCIIRNQNYMSLSNDFNGATVRYSCIPGGIEGDGNIDAIPLFADIKRGDYHLLSTAGRCFHSKQEWSTPSELTELNKDGNLARSPCLSPDGLTIYFDRFIPAMGHYCIVEAKRNTSNSPFTSERVLSELSTTGYNVTAPWVSYDGLRLYYKENDDSGAVIKMAERTNINDIWIPAKRTFDELNNNHGKISQPTLTRDELTIVFASDMIGSKGGLDLWLATRDDTNASFSNIRNLSGINTILNDSGPHLSPDGLTLYYNSIIDNMVYIYKSKRTSINTLFENSTLLDIPSLVPPGAAMIYVSPDEQQIYFDAFLLDSNKSVIKTSTYIGIQCQWLNDANSSPCIDAGGPKVNPMKEPMPNGARVNMGAYGGTAEASKSPNPWPNEFDYNQDGKVDLQDFVIFMSQWMWKAEWIN